MAGTNAKSRHKRGWRETERIVSEAEEQGIKPHQLDDLVHDVASETASAINNGGLSAQIEYLVEQIGAAETREALAQLSEDPEQEEEAQ